MWLERGRQGCGNWGGSLALVVLCKAGFLIVVNDGTLLCLFFFIYFFFHSYMLNRREMFLWCYSGILIIWALFQAPEINLGKSISVSFYSL